MDNFFIAYELVANNEFILKTFLQKTLAIVSMVTLFI